MRDIWFILVVNKQKYRDISDTADSLEGLSMERKYC